MIIIENYNGYIVYLQIGQDGKNEVYIVQPTHNKLINSNAKEFNNKIDEEKREILKNIIKEYGYSFRNNPGDIYRATIIFEKDEIPNMIIGKKHADCIKGAEAIGIKHKDMKNIQYGFINHRGQFLNRRQAYIEAKKYRQLFDESKTEELTSEIVCFRDI